MTISLDVLNYAYCGLLAAAFVLVLVRRAIHSPESRIAVLLLVILLVTLAGILYAGFEYHAPPDLLLSLLLIELGLFALIYDSYRTFKSISGTLRNMGSVYVFGGVVCILSRLTDFPVLLWLIPLLFFSIGYFFFRRRRGLGNLCKGLGVLVSVAFITSMLYDIHEGAAPPWHRGILKGRLLPEIIRPSIVEELNALNEKVIALEGEKRRLRGELAHVHAEYTELEGRVKQEIGKLGELEKAGAAAAETARKLSAERELLQEKLNRETAGRIESERKLAELESARAAVKEEFSAIEEKLNLAAENLKKVVAERDSIKAELKALRSRSAVPAAAASEGRSPASELQSLRQQVQEKEAERAALAAETAKLKETLDRIRMELSPEPAGVGKEGVPNQ
jgi:predicted  nucleic acid-binding Zn-ribbon protein